uniref:Global nitrogen transcriptional regulator n=1 Tax=Eucheuma denticulatum TaxID=305493 RepID=A0A8E7PGB1_9FLOR|nr:global nitrogen transcriptional regulator [Eucheuma denticulatum]
MTWINHFVNSKIPFYTYKLNKDDSIIYKQTIKNNKPLIVLHGIVYVLKIFTNQEIITLAILESGNIIYNPIPNENCYYQIIALKETFLISFSWKDLINNNKYIESTFTTNFIKSYGETIQKYEAMNNILAHKYVKNRVIQLILLLLRDISIINKEDITISYYISQITISLITGSTKATINKIMKELMKDKSIYYSQDKKIMINNPFFFINYKNTKNDKL